MKAEFNFGHKKTQKENKKNKQKRKKKNNPTKIKKKRNKQLKNQQNSEEENKSKKEIAKEIKKQKRIRKDFINLANYQEVDRKFIDFSKNYYTGNWIERSGKKLYPKDVKNLSISFTNQKNKIEINDLIFFKALIGPAKNSDFPNDFDQKIDARIKNISGFGFGFQEIKKIEKNQNLCDQKNNFSQIIFQIKQFFLIKNNSLNFCQPQEKSITSKIDDWFNQLREKIKQRILSQISENEAAISLAFLIGDQSLISKDLMEKIRNSGLAHLLSISGFHLSLASLIFFNSGRFIFSRSEYLSLHFDLKKLSIIFAIFSAYFYLKIANSPIPAKRAFVMILFSMLAIFFDQKANILRIAMISFFVLILANPYYLFSISFQLTFVAIFTLIFFQQEISPKLSFRRNWFFTKILIYFLQIILISFLVQITTFPFLISHFPNVAVLGFLSNIFAIPLVSFLIMPLEFLSLFLMPLGLEKYSLILNKELIIWLEKIIIFFGNIKFSYQHFYLPKFALIITTFGLFLFFLQNSYLRLIGGLIFILSFSAIFFNKSPYLIFDGSQKFFAIYNKQDGLVFSKKIKQSKKVKNLMSYMQESKFKSLENFSKQWKFQRKIYCNQQNCVVENDKKFLILLARNKISRICKKDFDFIVNLTSKYQLPKCIKSNQIIIDNIDFYQKGGRFIYQ
jgi:ComEC/Rec2-related protein